MNLDINIYLYYNYLIADRSRIFDQSNTSIFVSFFLPIALHKSVKIAQVKSTKRKIVFEIMFQISIFIIFYLQELVRRIEIQPKTVYWSENGELCCIATEESYFVLKFNNEAVAAAAENKDKITEDGVEDAFDVLGEVNESVKTGLWVGDCFIYTNSVNRLNYYVGGEIVTVSHLDR